MLRFFRYFSFSLILLLPAVANAAMWEFQGGLNIAQSVAADASPGDTTVPSPYFGGGSVTASLNDVSGDFTWDFGFGGLSGPAGDAHFHEALAGAQGGVTVPVVVAGGAGTFSGSTTLAGADLTGAISALTGDGSFVPGDITGWYLNLHTGLNPIGELRGQLFVTSVVPIPAAVWLLISALGIMLGARRFA